MFVLKWLSTSISPYSIVGLLQQVVMTLCNLVVLHWVTPSEIGIWQIMVLVEGYCQIVRVGVVNAMTREYPFLLGQGNRAAARRVVQTAQTYTAGVAVLVSGGTAFASIFFRSDPRWFQALLTLALCGGANLFRGFLESTFRSGADFARLALVQILTTLLALGTLFVVWVEGFQGLLQRYVILSLIPLVACWVCRPVRVGWHMDCARLRELMISGFPLFLNNYLTGFAQSLPRLILGLAGGTVMLGLYAPVAALINAGQLLPGVLGTYLLPKLNFEYGQTNSARKVLSRCWGVSLAITALMLPLPVAGWLCLPGFVAFWLPAYSAATPALELALLACGISGLTLVGLLFSTLKTWRHMFYNMIFVLASNALLSSLAAFLITEHMLAAIAAAQVLALLLQVGFMHHCLRRGVAALGVREAARLSIQTPS